ncbi:hypothetical protein A3Q56_06546 [Intoshia linei]|uniref:Uncharacterized protein n=1 Tax=Intoshia linei TaxID=1819745 RepID=A0A177AV74_9BILA|nr:hypothetical protein A3Q56_06546 [Intoshia linei]
MKPEKCNNEQNKIMPLVESSHITDSLLKINPIVDIDQSKKLIRNKKRQVTEYKTLQENPSLSTSYKSLFNTCEKAKKQPKPNWVTNDPGYY